MSTTRSISDSPAAAVRAADILKAVAHPLRLRIVALLCGSELHVGALAKQLDVKQPIVSQQLRILRMHGLIRSRRRDGLVINELAEPELRKLLACMESCLVRQHYSEDWA